LKLLQVDSSARASSVTRKLTRKFVEEWRREHPHGEVIHRDLSKTVLPLITDDWNGVYADPSSLTDAQRKYLTTSDELIAEVQAADIILIGAPMYNFMVSSLLKAWIDQIARIGKTFTYGPNGPRGLLEKKKVIVITGRGGAYRKGTPTEPFDFQEPYLKHIFGFIGLSDVTFIHAENQSRAEAAVSFDTATQHLSRIVSEHSRQLAAQGV
jgi:FMN-dependent NADH-azoreductase